MATLNINICALPTDVLGFLAYTLASHGDLATVISLAHTCQAIKESLKPTIQGNIAPSLPSLSLPPILPHCSTNPRSLPPSLSPSLPPLTPKVRTIPTSKFSKQCTLCGHLHLLKWGLKHNCKWSTRTCANAARHGHLDLLKWVRRRGCPWDYETFKSAAKSGNLPTMKWVTENRCNFVNSAFSSAAKRGNFEILKYLVDFGFKGFEYHICNGAAEGQHEDILSWAIPKTYSIAKIEELLVISGRVDIISNLEAQVDDENWREKTKRGAAVFAGNLELLDEKSGDRNFAEFFSGLVAQSGRADVLDAMEQYGITWKSRSFLSMAAARGHLDLVKRAISLGCPYYPQQIIQNAAQSGDVDLLIWLMEEKEIPWDIKPAASAAFYGRLHVLQWASKKGLLLDGTLYCWAIQNQNLSPKKLIPVLDWLRNSGFKISDPAIEILEYAAVYPNRCALDWLKNWPEFPMPPKKEVVPVVVKHGTSSKMEWLAENFGVKVEKWKNVIIVNAIMKEDLTFLEKFKGDNTVVPLLGTSGDPRIRDLAKKGKK